MFSGAFVLKTDLLKDSVDRETSQTVFTPAEIESCRWCLPSVILFILNDKSIIILLLYILYIFSVYVKSPDIS